MTSVCRYHAAASDSVARQAIVHDKDALGGAVAPFALARSAGSNLRVSPGAIANVTVPLARPVVPLGNGGWSGIGGSDAPGGSVGLLEADGRADVAADGVAVVVVEVGDGDGRAVDGAGAVVVDVGASVVGAAVGTTALLTVARGVGVVAMRSVSVHAAARHSATTARRTRIYRITGRTRPVRSVRGPAGTAVPLWG
jgi:hypothetical protein